MCASAADAGAADGVVSHVDQLVHSCVVGSALARVCHHDL